MVMVTMMMKMVVVLMMIVMAMAMVLFEYGAGVEPNEVKCMQVCGFSMGSCEPVNGANFTIPIQVPSLLFKHAQLQEELAGDGVLMRSCLERGRDEHRI